MPTWVDTCQDGVKVGTSAGENFVYFTTLLGVTTAVPTPDWGIFTRAAAFGNTHCAVTKTQSTNRCLFVRETGQVLDVGPSAGNYSQVLMPSPDKSILYLASMETVTHYRKILFAPDFSQISNTLIAIPAGQTATEGFLDITPFGEPIFTSSRRELTVNGTPLIFPVERNGVWLGQDGSGTDNILLVSPNGTVTIVYAGLAFEPHLTLSADNTTLYISFRANVPGPDGEFGQFRDAPSGGILQSLYVPKIHPFLDPKTNRPTKPYLDFFDRIAAFLGQPVNLAQAAGILDPSQGGTGNNSGGGGTDAPTDAEYLVAVADPTLTDERVVTSTATVAWDFSVPGAASANVPDDAITFAKMQNIATQRVMGRNTAATGSPEEVTATQALDWIGSTRGAVLYRGAAGWAILAPGAATDVLTSNGAGADPSYQPASGGDDYVVLSDSVQPPTPMDDGAGNFLYVPYTP